MICTCIDCGADFYRDPAETWKKRCLGCWKASKAVHRPAGEEEATRWYRRGFEAGRAAAMAEVSPSGEASIDADRLRQLIRLCHPDLHNGSELATNVTAWLLDLRKRVTA